MGLGVGIDYIADDQEEIVDVTENEEIELQKKSKGLEQIENFIDKSKRSEYLSISLRLL
jgi:hypothetical protein